MESYLCYGMKTLRLAAVLALLWANGITVSNLSVNQAAGTVTFDISWQNSWRAAENWDAACGSSSSSETAVSLRRPPSRTGSSAPRSLTTLSQPLSSLPALMVLLTVSTPALTIPGLPYQ
jgi:hypothetical protein